MGVGSATSCTTMHLCPIAPDPDAHTGSRRNAPTWGNGIAPSRSVVNLTTTLYRLLSGCCRCDYIEFTRPFTILPWHSAPIVQFLHGLLTPGAWCASCAGLSVGIVCAMLSGASRPGSWKVLKEGRIAQCETPHYVATFQVQLGNAYLPLTLHPGTSFASHTIRCVCIALGRGSWVEWIMHKPLRLSIGLRVRLQRFTRIALALLVRGRVIGDANRSHRFSRRFSIGHWDVCLCDSQGVYDDSPAHR